MIHSLSGGVICDVGIYSFAKVELTEGFDEGRSFWYLNEFPELKEGDAVRVPRGRMTVLGKVVRIEENSEQTAPVPMNRIQSIEEIV